MNRFYLCATVVAALSAVSFPAGALMFGAASIKDAKVVSIKEPLTPTALSPEGKPVRVISLLAADRAGDAAPTLRQPELSGLSISEITPPPATKLEPVSEVPAKPAMHPAKHVRPAPRHAVAVQQSTRSASALAKKAFVVSGLY